MHSVELLLHAFGSYHGTFLSRYLSLWMHNFKFSTTQTINITHVDTKYLIKSIKNDSYCLRTIEISLLFAIFRVLVTFEHSVQSFSELRDTQIRQI